MGLTAVCSVTAAVITAVPGITDVPLFYSRTSPKMIVRIRVEADFWNRKGAVPESGTEDGNGDHERTASQRPR
jgi:hypothetical protein